MSKAQNAPQSSDGNTGFPELMQDDPSASEAITYGRAQDRFPAGQAGIEDCGGPGFGSLLSGPAAPKGRKSLFRR